MLTIGQDLADSIVGRILDARDVYDSPAPPLKPAYAKWKGRKYPPAVRNWKMTGRTIRSIKVLEAGHNRAVIGFSDPVAAKRAGIQQSKCRQFGVSPSNAEALALALERGASPVAARAA